AQGQPAQVAMQMLADPALARSELGLGAGYERPGELSEETIRAYLEPVAGSLDAARGIERYINAVDADQLLAAEPELKKLAVPTVVVWGTGDTFFGVDWAYWLRDTIPGVTEVVELDGA